MLVPSFDGCRAACLEFLSECLGLLLFLRLRSKFKIGFQMVSVATLYGLKYYMLSKISISLSFILNCLTICEERVKFIANIH